MWLVQFMFLFPAVIIFLILMMLRHTKSKRLLNHYGNQPLPGFPGPAGLVMRLDGMDRKQRKIVHGRRLGNKKDGVVVLPPAWEQHMTAGRMACVAHAWAWSVLAETDPEGDTKRMKSINQAKIVCFFACLIALAIVFFRHANPLTVFAITAFLWAFLAFAGLPTQIREKQATDLAKKGLKEAGLWPQLTEDAYALEACLQAMSWSRVAGFPRIWPR